MCLRMTLVLAVLSCAVFVPSLAFAAMAEAPKVTFSQERGRLVIRVGERPFATYVFEDESIPRPYFCAVHAPDGTPVTRNHPPVEGQEPTDHDTYHPGLWLAFGDISGADFWRNKARVEHAGFAEEPRGGPGEGSFAVRNRYLADGKVLCEEVCRYRLLVRPEGYLLLHESEFFFPAGDFVFGDQEEMGLGVRVAAPLMVKNGGSIINSEGQRDEAGAWGKVADWCEYAGVVDSKRLGIVLMPYPANFRSCWFHVRDYGLMLANPFGRNAFTEGEKSAVVVKKDEKFPLRFGVFIYATGSTNASPAPAAYQEYLTIAGAAAGETSSPARPQARPKE